MNDAELLTRYQEAVSWVIEDAAYKSPEQIGEVGDRWLSRLLRINKVEDGRPGARRDRGED